MTDEFNDLVRQKYQLGTVDELLKLSYKERNKQLYDILRHYKVCVVPSSKIESFDHLPQFTIIETSLRDIKRQHEKITEASKEVKNTAQEGSAKEAQEQKNKFKGFDPRKVKGNVELF